MLFPRFATLLEQIHSLRFLQIQMVKVLDIEHGGLYHLKVVRSSEGLVQSVVSAGLIQPVSTILQQSIDFKKNRIHAFQ
jgi:hypothetical protein